MKMLTEKYQYKAEPSIKSFYITGDSGDVCWLGYNLEPPHLDGRFGLDKASLTVKKRIEEVSNQKRLGYFFYGSLSIDSPPISDDKRFLFKASDSVVWKRAVKVEAQLKDALFRRETHDEQVF